MARSNALRTTRSFLALIVFVGLVVPGLAFALEFTAPLPKTIVPERVGFTLKTRTSEFVFFEADAVSVGSKFRFARLDGNTGLLLDQPLLGLPELDSSLLPYAYSNAKAVAMNDGGFVLALANYAPFNLPTSTRFYHFDSRGQFLATTYVVGHVSEFFQSGPDEIIVFANQSGPRLAMRIRLHPNLPTQVDVSAEQICPDPPVCDWQLAPRVGGRAFDALEEVQLLRKRRVSNERQQMELLRVGASGNVLSAHTIGELPAGSYAYLVQYQQGILLSIVRGDTNTLYFYGPEQQLLWSFVVPRDAYSNLHADASGLTAVTYGGSERYLLRLDGAGAVQWRLRANAIGRFVFHGDGSVAMQQLANGEPAGWRWVSQVGALRSLPEGVRSFAFSSDGGAIAAEPALTAASSTRVHRFNAQGQLMLTQPIVGAGLILDRLTRVELKPGGNGVDLSYPELNAMQVWRYAETGLPGNFFQIPGLSELPQVVIDSADRSFVVSPRNTLLALGPFGRRLWERPGVAGAIGAITPLRHGVVFASHSEFRSTMSTVDAYGALIDTLEMEAGAAGIFCKAIAPVADSALSDVATSVHSRDDLASCVYRAGADSPLAIFRVDRNLRFSQPSVISTIGAVQEITDDGGAILRDPPEFSEHIRYIRINRFGELTWELQSQGGALVPTRSGGAWLRAADDELHYVDASGVSHGSGLALAGSMVTIADDSLLLSAANQITRVNYVAGEFLVSQHVIGSSQVIVGAITVNGMSSAWLERTRSRHEYFVHLMDWPALVDRFKQ